jgi:hypothetical protein
MRKRWQPLILHTMKRNITLFLSIILLLACKENREESGTIKMTLYESYDLGEIYPSILTVNNIIRKQQLDSIAEKSSGSAILDEMNRSRAKSDTIDGKSLEDYPLFRHLFTSYRIGKNGKALFDSLAIIATTKIHFDYYRT